MQRLRYLISVLALAALAGCATPQPKPVNDLPSVEYESVRVIITPRTTVYFTNEIVLQNLLYTNFASVEAKLTP